MKTDAPITRYTRAAVNVPYTDAFNLSGEGWLEATAWANGEGVDITTDPHASFALTWAQWTALKRAMKEITR